MGRGGGKDRKVQNGNSVQCNMQALHTQHHQAHGTKPGMRDIFLCKATPGFWARWPLSGQEGGRVEHAQARHTF